MKTDVLVTPPSTTIPFMPNSPHPSTSETEQMINSRVQAAVEQLRSEFKNTQISNQRNREYFIGVVGGVVGIFMFVGGKWVFNRLRAPAAGR